jgi:hypothetical protein
MDAYTMTFKYDGLFDLPSNPESRALEVTRMVLDKMESNEFELIDFNLTANYDGSNAADYINDEQIHRAVLEIKVDLSMRTLKSREAIYKCCLEALQKGKVTLYHAYENENRQKGIYQSIIVFDMKHRQMVPA